MSGVLQRLEPIIGDPLSENGDEINPTWGLSKRLAEKKDSFFHPLVMDHMRLNLRYTVICAQLAHDFALKESSVNSFTEEEREALTQKLVDALSLAELLARVYIRLNVPSEIQRLQSEQAVYRLLLTMRGYKFPEDPPVYNFESTLPLSRRISAYLELLNWPHLLIDGLSRIVNLIEPLLKLIINYLADSSHKLRSYTGALNFPRLMVVRTRRILMTLIPVIKNIENYAKFINLIDPFIGPVLNYLAWIFYAPRLAVNLFLLIKHLIPGKWLSEEEKQLSWLIRLQAQLERRWFELFNDSAWFIGGFLGCFFLVGGLSPAGMYLTISLFFYDVVLAGIRAFIELGRINTLRTEYKELALNSSDKDLIFQKGLASYQDHLEQSYSYEQKKMGISILSTIALFLGMLFAIPAIANPIVPLVGACLVLTITLLTYLAQKWLEGQKPPGVSVEKITLEGIKRFEKKPFEQIPYEEPSVEKPTFAKSSFVFFQSAADFNNKSQLSFSESTHLAESSLNEERQLEEQHPQVGIL
ncbi:MAG: hypothetical protein H0T84_06180 [Tatlockia sp.]|nr:hypothetical protein [Tatlockia sp.]